MSVNMIEKSPAFKEGSTVKYRITKSRFVQGKIIKFVPAGVDPSPFVEGVAKSRIVAQKRFYISATNEDRYLLESEGRMCMRTGRRGLSQFYMPQANVIHKHGRVVNNV